MDRVQWRKVLIVEDDAEQRPIMKMVLEESELDIIECDSAEIVLATMLLRGQEVAMIFADIRLSGVMEVSFEIRGRSHKTASARPCSRYSSRHSRRRLSVSGLEVSLRSSQL